MNEDLKQHRREVSQLHEDLEELEDHLDILEARCKSLGKPTLTQAEMERRYATK